jgi:glutaredoxin
MRFTVAMGALLLFAFAGSALADVYRYTDSRGELHFVDDIAKVPKKYRTQLENADPQGNVSVMDATPAAHSVRGRTAEEPEQRQDASSGGATIEVYMTSWCGYCKKMIRFLNEKGIPYTAYDIEKDGAAARVYHDLGGRGVPVVRVGSHVVYGYSPEAVMSYYNGGK